MKARGFERRRREEIGAGTYMLLNQATNGVALFAATLGDIAAFLKDHDQNRQCRLH
jgi:hypothetical protein